MKSGRGSAHAEPVEAWGGVFHQLPDAFGLLRDWIIGAARALTRWRDDPTAQFLSYQIGELQARSWITLGTLASAQASGCWSGGCALHTYAPHRQVGFSTART